VLTAAFLFVGELTLQFFNPDSTEFPVRRFKVPRDWQKNRSVPVFQVSLCYILKEIKAEV